MSEYIDFPAKLRSTRRDRKLVDAAAIDGILERSQLPADLGDGETPLIENVFDGMTGTDTGEVEIAGVTIESNNNVAYLIRVRASTEYALGNTLHALRSNAPLEIGIANFYSKGGADAGKLYHTLDEATDDTLEIWKVNDLAAIRSVVQATGKTGAEIIDLIEAETGNDRLDASAIKNLPQPVSGLAGVRTESIAFQGLSSATTDIELDPIEANPIVVEHGDGAAELLTGLSGHDFTVAPGLYLITAEGGVGGGAVGNFDLEIRDASDDSVIASLSEVFFYNTQGVRQPFTATGYWHPTDDTEINVLMNRHGRTCSLPDLKLSFSRLTTEEAILTQPDSYHVIFLSENGNDDLDGRTFAKAVRDMNVAMTKAKAFTPATAHRTIFSLEAGSHNALINRTGLEPNMANLVVDCRSAIFEQVDLSRKTNMLCRRVTGNANGGVTLGSGSQLEVWGSLGDTGNARAVGFVAGAHSGTLLKVRTMLSTVTMSFVGITSGSRVRVEVDDWQVSDFEAAMKTLLDTIPDGVEVTGWIGEHNFGESPGTSTGYTPARAVDVQASPAGGRFRIGADGEDFVHDGTLDKDHWTDVAAFSIDALLIGSTLAGTIYLERHVSGVSFPAAYYYRAVGDPATAIVPTTDGTDTAPSDLRAYLGSSHRMFYTDSEFNELSTDTSIAHTLTYPHKNYGQSIMTEHQSDDLQVVFAFPDFDVNVASFVADLVIRENTGFRSSTGPAARVWNGKNQIRFNRVAKNRYSMTLGTDSSFGNENVKVEDFFKLTEHAINLNTGSHTNQVTVNGQVGFLVPYVPESQLMAEAAFSVETVEKST